MRLKCVISNSIILLNSQKINLNKADNQKLVNVYKRLKIANLTDCRGERGKYVKKHTRRKPRVLLAQCHYFSMSKSLQQHFPALVQIYYAVGALQGRQYAAGWGYLVL